MAYKTITLNRENLDLAQDIQNDLHYEYLNQSIILGLRFAYLFKEAIIAQGDLTLRIYDKEYNLMDKSQLEHAIQDVANQRIEDMSTVLDAFERIHAQYE